MPIDSTSSAKPIVTNVAVERFSDFSFRGFRVYADLLGNESFTSLVALSICGRRLSRAEAAFIDEMVLAFTGAEPRAWTIKIARIVASHGSFLGGLAAGLLSSEGGISGPWLCAEAAPFLAEAERALRGADDAAVVRYVEKNALGRRLFAKGFGVPMRSVDERATVVANAVESHSRSELPYWQLLKRLDGVVFEKTQKRPNIVGVLSAAFLDLGIGAHQIAPLVASFTLHMFAPNALEGAEQQAEVLKALPEDCVEFVGTGPRTSPRQRARKT